MTKVTVDNFDQRLKESQAWEDERLVMWNCTKDEMTAMLRAARRFDIALEIMEHEANGRNPIDLMGFRIAKDIDMDSQDVV